MSADDSPLPSEARSSLCLYRRSAGRTWWRVDAEISHAGVLTVTSGDGDEWAVVVAARDVAPLLLALRREGDLTASIGGGADDELLARLAERFGPAGSGALDEVKAFLAQAGIRFEARFWSGGDAGQGMPAPDGLDAVLREALCMVEREGADFSWSGWADVDDARDELRALMRELPGAPAKVAAAAGVIFALAGPLQELAMASGFADDYLRLAQRADAAVERLTRQIDRTDG